MITYTRAIVWKNQADAQTECKCVDVKMTKLEMCMYIYPVHESIELYDANSYISR